MLKKTVILIAGMALFFGLSGSKTPLTDTEVTVVSRPPAGVQSANYQSNRAPLQPALLIRLPLGSIQPQGWILKLLELQKDGLCGHLGEISAWLEKKDNAWLSEGGEHGWEEVPYWLRGYADMAFIFNDPAMKKEAMVWIEAIFKSQKASGWFGPEFKSRDTNNLDFWPNMVVLFTLQHYYENSHDTRVLEFMKNYFRFELAVPEKEFLTSYWEKSRGGDNLYSVYWLYNLTGEEWLLPLAEKIHRNTANWMRQTSLPNWHNVNIAQCFREPATWFMQTGDSTHLKATYNNFDLIRRTFGQVPGGMFGSDENARMGYIDPRQGTETCGFAEQMTSDGILTSITADPLWADNCEDVLFNSFTAAFTPDMKALRYITSPNGVTADDKNHAPGIANEGPFLTMNPFSSRCCQHNHGHALPYYLQNLVMASNDNGLAAVMYNACEISAKVGGQTEIRLTEETRYPFEEKVRFILHTDKKVTFPLYLRIPGWCTKASVEINGKPVDLTPHPGTYFRIAREWSDRDQVTLHLPMEIGLRTWQVNQNSMSVNYGPLTFSLKIGEEYRKLSSTASAIGDSKWQKNADPEKWPAFEIMATTPWNYGLVLDEEHPERSFTVIRKAWPAGNDPFNPEKTPILLAATGRQIPSWGIDRHGLVDMLPLFPARSDQPVEEITLIPMGAARLRISAFPAFPKTGTTAASFITHHEPGAYAPGLPADPYPWSGNLANQQERSGNPLFKGWYADPEAIIYGDRYWIYPTFSAEYEKQVHFDCFSSPDLVHWTKHENILDTTEVKWAWRCMWAPGVIEKEGKYYLFFGANDVHEGEVGGIGVAVADRPEGPYRDLIGKPLINEIINGAQPIDQFVFRDKDGSYYMFYGGWRHCNVVKLNDDFTELVPLPDGNLVKEVTPEGYVEGPVMFMRNGKYYFMWSEGGWTGPNYRVAYAISDHPFGPFKRIGTVLQQDREVATGAGHHSVINIPGSDDWYIVYHRRPLGETSPHHRVTCIDRMEFDDKGHILPVKITFEGVAPRLLRGVLIDN